MNINELIEQIGGRERLEALIEDEDCRVTVTEQEILVQIALAVLDAQENSTIRKLKALLWLERQQMRGKCVPAKMRVNESLAEYLVRQFDALHERADRTERERDELPEMCITEEKVA